MRKVSSSQRASFKDLPRPSGIEGTRRLRVDAGDVAPFLIGRLREQDPQKQAASRWEDWQLNFLVVRYFRLEQVG
jgi:hypothetical protein